MNKWTEHNNALYKTFEFSSFLEAMEWMQKASVEIDTEPSSEMDQHVQHGRSTTQHPRCREYRYW